MLHLFSGITSTITYQNHHHHHYYHHNTSSVPYQQGTTAPPLTGQSHGSTAPPLSPTNRVLRLPLISTALPLPSPTRKVLLLPPPPHQTHTKSTVIAAEAHYTLPRDTPQKYQVTVAAVTASQPGDIPCHHGCTSQPTWGRTVSLWLLYQSASLEPCHHGCTSQLANQSAWRTSHPTFSNLTRTLLTLHKHPKSTQKPP